ncbi:MAG: flagellar basal-body MS-ring/collar protein FliF [Planctomycetaceae bacterium]
METIKNALSQAQRVWERSSRGNKIATIAMVLVSAVSIFGVGIWSMQPQYIPLALELETGQVTTAKTRIEAAGIPVKMNFNATGILVPKSQWNAARLAAGDAIPEGFADPELQELGPLDSREKHREIALRNNELRLQATIRQIQGIKNATVHISKPDDELFVRENGDTRASVVLDLDRGRTFSRTNAETIVQLVSHGVEGLAPDNVSVSTTRGENLRGLNAGVDSEVQAQLEYRKLVEAHIAGKAESLLSQMLGTNNAIVRVSADIDFTTLKIIDTRYDAEGKVAADTKIDNETTYKTGRSAIGPVGTTPNLAGQTGTGVLRSSPDKKENITSKFLVPKTVETTNGPKGKLQRLTVAAMVDLSGFPEGAAKPTLEQIKALIRTATGIDETRTDTIEVVEATLPDLEELIPVAAPAGWNQYRDMFQVVSLGLASLVAFVLGFMTLRRMKPITLKSEAAADARREQLLANISNQAERDPETVSRIVAAWLNEPLPSDEEAKSSDPVRAAA